MIEDAQHLGIGAVVVAPSALERIGLVVIVKGPFLIEICLLLAVRSQTVSNGRTPQRTPPRWMGPLMLNDD
jgi:hypothetical protein